MELFYVYFIVYDHVHALSATSTHSKWELMLYCLHCPTLNKVFLLLLLLLLICPGRGGTSIWGGGY